MHSQSGSPNLLLQNTLAAPITVTPTTLGPIASAEAGPFKFKVVLSQQPSANVVMDLSVGEALGQVGCTTSGLISSFTCWNACWNACSAAPPTPRTPANYPTADSSRASLSPSSLSFTKSDWQEAQTVTLTRECASG